MNQRTERLSIKSSGVRFRATYRAWDNLVERVSLVAIGRESQDRIELVTPEVKDLTARDGSGHYDYEVSATVRLDPVAASKARLDDIYDLQLEFHLAGVEEPASRGIYAPLFHRRLLIRHAVIHGDGISYLFVPFFSFKGGRLVFRTERFKTEDWQYLRRILRFGWLFFLARPFARIWLIGELPYKAQDNGFNLFRWIRTNHPNRRVYYVMEADSPERENVAPFGNVIERCSRQHITYTLLASRFLGTHHAEYLFASRTRLMLLWARGIRIFLQHGVMGTKNMAANYGRQSRDFRTDLFLVSSEFERDLIVNDFGFRRHQVRVTGLSRFDALLEPVDAVEPSILIIPTWRDWLLDEGRFVHSEFLLNWHEFLAHPRLRSLLDEHGLTARFIPHPNMGQYAKSFEVPGIEVIRQGEASVQDLMRRSSVMITDFSSVGFDFSFLDRPVIYFQFDREQFVGERPSHLDLDEHLPGRIATHADELVDILTQTIEHGSAVEEKYLARSRRFMTHRDQKNSQRIYEVALRPWRPSITIDRLRNNKIVVFTIRKLRRPR